MSTTPTPGPGHEPGPRLHSPEAVRADTRKAIYLVLGIAVSLVAVLIVAGLLIAGYVFRRVGIHSSGNHVEISTPVGSMFVNGDEGRTGLPVYPGAVASSGHNGANIEFTEGKDGKRAGLAVAHLQTPDSLETVQAWYRAKLPASFQQSPGAIGSRSQPSVEITTDGGEPDVSFAEKDERGARVVALKRNGSGTEIELVKAGEREPQ